MGNKPEGFQEEVSFRVEIQVKRRATGTWDIGLGQYAEAGEGIGLRVAVLRLEMGSLRMP